MPGKYTGIIWTWPVIRRPTMATQRMVIKSYLTPEEYNAILASARRAGLSLSTFSKRVCLGTPVPSLERQEARLELRRIKGDLGRLGGLIKQTLTTNTNKTLIHKLLHELDARQREFAAAVSELASCTDGDSRDAAAVGRI
jgi:hypothetical protein